MYSDAIEMQLLLRMGLILLLGFLVGIERGWSFQKKKEGERTAGIRTFTLIALSGGFWGILSEHIDGIILGFALLGFVIIIMTGYFHHAKETGTLGLTTEIAAFLTFTIGIAVIKGYIILSVSVTIIMVLLLSIKPRLHKWVKTIEPEELYSGIIFLIISAILLPLLPNQGYGPWNVLNPFEIWGMVVLIAGISYVGFFAMKYLGKEKGILFTSFTGSLVSSLAVTVTLGKFSSKVKSIDVVITGILIATFTALGRVLLLALLFNPALITIIGPSVAVMAIVALGAAIYINKTREPDKSVSQFKLRNPLQLSTAIQFGIVLAMVMLLSEFSRQWFGDTGIYGLSLISGMIDIDSITLTLLDMGGENLGSNIAANGIILAAMTNTLVKGLIFTFFIGFKNAWKLLLFCLLIVVSALPGMLV
ncbi:MgtC/SapB family protein [Halalkalibaculum sp. DA384]|uniref:MgtC/SapB family protein n=1 Tax=Halalkalibaculum sp. DA384 TaxID=3373606 RepID=UPI003754B83E